MLFKTELTPALIDLLKREEIYNLNILGALDNLQGLTVYTDSATAPTGLLVVPDGYFHYLYTRNNAFIDAVFDEILLEGFFGFSGVIAEVAEYMMARVTMDWTSFCDLYYLKKENFDQTIKKHETQSLPVSYAPLVDSFYPYQHEHSLEDITECLTNRPSSAVFVDNEPVCWLMVHNDDSMGIMHTLEEHRRHGYAIDVTVHVCEQLYERNKTPYLQIVKSNDMSPGLALKCGFEKYGEVTWFGFVVGRPEGIEEFELRKLEESTPPNDY